VPGEWAEEGLLMAYGNFSNDGNLSTSIMGDYLMGAYQCLNLSNGTLSVQFHVCQLHLNKVTLCHCLSQMFPVASVRV
jgi:hypothetical protein